MQATAVRSEWATIGARRLLLFGMLAVLATAFVPRPVSGQSGPGTEYIECLDQAETDLANCYLDADGYRWREMLCNFAYYVDNIACATDLII